MDEQKTIQINSLRFRDFILKNKRNRCFLSIATIAIIIQVAIFKYLYPFANYIHGDSFSYLNAADANLSVNTYLIGYSKFLRLFSVFAQPDYMLVLFQYFSIQVSILFLLYTLFFFYQTGKIMQTILLAFMVFNPLFLHLGNLVSSDGMFLALSCTWVALLLWIVHKPTDKIIILHAAVLLIAFMFRYNAIIYPFLTILGFALSKLSIRKKILGSGLALSVCGLFIVYTMFQYKNLTGYWQYSPFSGWQFANNAMYAYRYVNKANRKIVPFKYKKLDNEIRDFFDSTKDTNKFPSEALQASTVYMWTKWMPLMKYRDELFKQDTAASELKKWASMGPFYKSYGMYIIKQYPVYFIKYFIWPNTIKYYAPPIEFLKFYNSGNKTVLPVAKKWFGYKNDIVKTRAKNNTVIVLEFYPILSGITNVLMLFFLFFYFTLNARVIDKPFGKGLVIASIFWLFNACFTISASSAALRFQSFPISISVIFVCLLIDWILKVMHSLQTGKKESIDASIKRDGILISN